MDWAILIVAGLFAGFWLVGDLVNVGRAAKLFLLFFFSFRLIFDISSIVVTIPLLGSFDLGVYYLFLIALHSGHKEGTALRKIPPAVYSNSLGYFQKIELRSSVKE